MVKFLITFVLTFITGMVLTTIMNRSFAATVMASVIVVAGYALVTGRRR